jgi:hypothetical protein
MYLVSGSANGMIGYVPEVEVQQLAHGVCMAAGVVCSRREVQHARTDQAGEIVPAAAPTNQRWAIGVKVLVGLPSLLPPPVSDRLHLTAEGQQALAWCCPQHTVYQEQLARQVIGGQLCCFVTGRPGDSHAVAPNMTQRRLFPVVRWLVDPLR